MGATYSAARRFAYLLHYCGLLVLHVGHLRAQHVLRCLQRLKQSKRPKRSPQNANTAEHHTASPCHSTLHARLAMPCHSIQPTQEVPLQAVCISALCALSPLGLIDLVPSHCCKMLRWIIHRC